VRAARPKGHGLVLRFLPPPPPVNVWFALLRGILAWGMYFLSMRTLK
jgi:hypothetical protein